MDVRNVTGEELGPLSTVCGTCFQFLTVVVGTVDEADVMRQMGAPAEVLEMVLERHAAAKERRARHAAAPAEDEGSVTVRLRQVELRCAELERRLSDLERRPAR